MDVVQEIRENKIDVGGSKFEQYYIGYIVLGFGYSIDIRQREELPLSNL